MAPWYSARPLRAARQVSADVVFLVWCLAWWMISRQFRDWVGTTLQPAADSTGRLSTMSSSLRSAADSAADLPLLGSLSSALRSLSEATAGLAGGTSSSIEAINRAAGGLALAVLGLSIVIGLLAWLPPRLRFVRRSLQLSGLDDSAGSDSLVALRALGTQPVRTLRAIHPDPAAAWRADQPEVVAALAALERRELGWRTTRSGSAQR